MSILKLEEIKSLQGTGNTVITFDSSDRAVFAQPPLTAVPIFHVYLGSSQSVTPSTTTKIQLNTVLYDTESWFNTSTHEYTPQIPGYYNFTLTTSSTWGTAGRGGLNYLYKNDSVTQLNYLNTSGATNVIFRYGFTSSLLLHMNGIDDKISAYVQLISGATTSVSGGSSVTFLTGFLVRAT